MNAIVYSARVHFPGCDGLQKVPGLGIVPFGVRAGIGFPPFYGKNMNAWIDCMTSLDTPDDGMPTVHCEPGTVLTIELENAKDFALRCPEQYEVLASCAVFVNTRRVEVGEAPVIAL